MTGVTLPGRDELSKRHQAGVVDFRNEEREFLTRKRPHELEPKPADQLREAVIADLFTRYSQQDRMGNVVETPFDVPFDKPLRSRPVALHTTERSVTTMIRT